MVRDFVFLLTKKRLDIGLEGGEFWAEAQDLLKNWATDDFQKSQNTGERPILVIDEVGAFGSSPRCIDFQFSKLHFPTLEKTYLKRAQTRAITTGETQWFSLVDEDGDKEVFAALPHVNGEKQKTVKEAVPRNSTSRDVVTKYLQDNFAESTPKVAKDAFPVNKSERAFRREQIMNLLSIFEPLAAYCILIFAGVDVLTTGLLEASDGDHGSLRVITISLPPLSASDWLEIAKKTNWVTSGTWFDEMVKRLGSAKAARRLIENVVGVTGEKNQLVLFALIGGFRRSCAVHFQHLARLD
jgi:hypothetical protein